MISTDARRKVVAGDVAFSGNDCVLGITAHVHDHNEGAQKKERRVIMMKKKKKIYKESNVRTDKKGRVFHSNGKEEKKRRRMVLHLNICKNVVREIMVSIVYAWGRERTCTMHCRLRQVVSKTDPKWGSLVSSREGDTWGKVEERWGGERSVTSEI